MARKGRPPQLTVNVSVFHPDAFAREVDADELDSVVSEPVIWGVSTGGTSPRLVSVEIAHGVSRATAAELLRRIAGAIEKSPEGFLATPRWEGGTFDVSRGEFVNEWQGLGDFNGKIE